MSNYEAMNLSVGDRIAAIPTEHYDLWPCEVVWIHPKRRFYMVEFKVKGGRLRECYHFPPEIVRLYK